ncbi:MAG: ankyrin repeat domain-containing protein [Alphaproteobacteria bacterium]
MQANNQRYNIWNFFKNSLVIIPEVLRAIKAFHNTKRTAAIQRATAASSAADVLRATPEVFTSISSCSYTQPLDEFEKIKKELEKRYPNMGYKCYIYPLFVAVKYNELEIAQELINNHLDQIINSFDELNHIKNNSSLLHIAVENRNISMLKLLLPLNIDKGFRDKNGDTALSKAIYDLNDEAIKLLREKNSDPNNEINPYRNIIQYVTRIAGFKSKGSTRAWTKVHNLQNFSFALDYFEGSNFSATTKLDEIKRKIQEVKDRLKINTSEYFEPVSDFGVNGFNITLLISFEEAKRVDKELRIGILSAAEGFATITPGLGQKNIGSHLAEYLDSVDAAKLRQVCKTINNSFVERILEAKNISILSGGMNKY